MQLINCDETRQKTTAIVCWSSLNQSNITTQRKFDVQNMIKNLGHVFWLEKNRQQTTQKCYLSMEIQY